MLSLFWIFHFVLWNLVEFLEPCEPAAMYTVDIEELDFYSAYSTRKRTDHLMVAYIPAANLLNDTA